MALLVAILISGVAGVISVMGLTSIFASSVIAVAIMGGVLEFAKVVAATWCHQNWTELSRWMKFYFSIAIVVLMFITSMGVYGFLAKAHIDQTVSMVSDPNMKRFATVSAEIKSVETKVGDLDTELKPLIANIDNLTRKSTEKLAETGQTKAARSDLSDAKGDLASMKKERNSLASKKDELTTTLTGLRAEKIQLEASVKRIEADVGAIRYISALFNDEPSTEQLEKAVRWMILLLVFVFDPLAITMIVAASSQIVKEKQKVRPVPSVASLVVPPGKKIVFRTERYNRKIDPHSEKVVPNRVAKRLNKRQKRGRVLNLSKIKI